jgi:hypothetical protein
VITDNKEHRIGLCEDGWEGSASGVLEIAIHCMGQGMDVDCAHPLEETQERKRAKEWDLNNDTDMTVDKMVRYNKQNDKFSLTNILALQYC